MTTIRFTIAGGAAGALLVIIESIWMAATVPGFLAHPLLDLAHFTTAVISLAGVAGAVAGVFVLSLGAGIHTVALRAARRDGRISWWTGSVAALASTPLWIYLVSSGFAGRWARSIAHRDLLVAVTAATLVGGTAILLRVTVAWWYRSRRSTKARAIAAALAGGALAVLVAADHLILPHQYALLHTVLRAAAFLAAVAGIASFTVHSAGRDGLTIRRRYGVGAEVRVAAMTLGGLLVLTVVAAAHVSRSPPSLRHLATLYGHFSDSLTDLSDRWALRRHRSIRASGGWTGPPAFTGRSAPHGQEPALLPGANILIITMDALRADHLGVYGYARPTSPALDALGQDSIVVERAYATTPHTSFSLASLFIGRPAMTLARLGDLQGKRTLADYARASGYHTAAFFPPAVFFVDSENFRSYEASKYGFQYVEYQEWPEQTSAADLTDRALKYFSEARPARFCVWLHYFAPHEPYVDHSDVGIPEFGRSAIDRYDSEIRWVDREIGRVLEFVRREYPRTVIVVTADHGEEFGDHGGSYHGTTLFDEQVRVPLLIHVPKQPPARITTPASTVDVLPTVLSLVGIPPDASITGQNLVARLTSSFSGEVGPSQAAGPPVFAENNDLKMVVADDHKLVCNVRRELCTLYDLRLDPNERRDVSESRPEVREHLYGLLRVWLDGGAAVQPSGAGIPTAQSGPGALRRALLSDRTAVPELFKLLVDPASPLDHRREAARLLAPLVDTDLAVQPVLRDAYRTNADPAIRGWIAVALARLGDWDAAADLSVLLERSTPIEKDLAVHLAVALARVGRGDVEVLGRLLDATEDISLRCSLMDALVQTGTDRAGAELVRAYEVVRSRICCASALRRLASPATLGFLLSRVANEPYALVQIELLLTVSRLGRQEHAALVRDIKDQTQEPQVAAAAATVLQTLEEQLEVVPLAVPPPGPVRRRCQNPSADSRAHCKPLGRIALPIARPAGATGEITDG